MQSAIHAANTSLNALELARQADLPLGDWICRLARSKALAVVDGRVTIEVWALDRQGNPVGHAGFA